MIFQSTLPRRERRSDPRHPAAQQRDFNPRSRVGSDARSIPPPLLSIYFNPRSRVGSDYDGEKQMWIAKISIHAPA